MTSLLSFATIVKKLELLNNFDRYVSCGSGLSFSKTSLKKSYQVFEISYAIVA
jgi:hypothetical protein